MEARTYLWRDESRAVGMAARATAASASVLRTVAASIIVMWEMDEVWVDGRRDEKTNRKRE